MRFLLPGFVVAVAAVILSACGGGGGGAGGGTSPSAVTVTLQPTNVSTPPGATIRFVATVKNGSVNTVTWSATAGTIVPTGGNSASFAAPLGEGTYTVTATSTDDPTRSASALVTVSNSATTANVAGRVVRDGSTAGVPGVTVRFFASGGAQVGEAVTNATGHFSAVIPANATQFHLANTPALNGFYRQFNFNSQSYSILIPDCRAPLPPLTAGSSTTLPTDIALPVSSGPPPPPPTGCL